MARRVATPAAIRRLDRKFRDLDLAKQRLKNIMNRKLPEIIALGAADLPKKIQKQIELTIRNEGWMENIIEDRFYREGTRSYGGERWKQIKYRFGPILQDTGRMKRAAMRAVRSTFKLDQIRPLWNIDRVRVKYAVYHQFGAENLDARPFFDSPDDKELKPVWDRAKQLVIQELKKYYKRK
jgi:phage gpG-like protein